MGRESKGIVGGKGRREPEVAKGKRAVTKGRMVGWGPVGLRRGRGHRDLGRERGVVDTVEFGGWAERRRVIVILNFYSLPITFYATFPYDFPQISMANFII